MSQQLADFEKAAAVTGVPGYRQTDRQMGEREDEWTDRQRMDGRYCTY